ncbi:unnamed protein product [Pseudo-nitzschia multistriata]|uniref:tRNA-5-taurinomethyluridine 2-sulfurtransferase n=1 Tax=Pseudo-nitzschia multistriata TaxID=183589 RepID=A0A448YW36_9STRA|nr:unnamed protein product [Pseudo-nitzschia multistriata]
MAAMQTQMTMQMPMPARLSERRTPSRNRNRNRSRPRTNTSPWFLALCVVAQTAILRSNKAPWLGTNPSAGSPPKPGLLPTCHSFTAPHRRPVAPKGGQRSFVLLSEPSGGGVGDNGNGSGNTESDGFDPGFGFRGASVEDIQQHLVRKGLAFSQVSVGDDPGMARVPGCVATVYVSARPKSGQGGRDTVSLAGSADAILSRGLLALLAEHLEDKTPGEVLEMDPSGLAEALGVRLALGKGRNDGLASMLAVIQGQLGGERESDHGDKCEPDLGDKCEISETPSAKPTVALLLSGGVDSSVAFRLLLEQGYEVVPFYLKIWLEDELAHLGECPWEDDVQTCREVCDQVGIDLQIVSLQDEYHDRVMKHTLNECSLGRTPNPDILCNSRVKFGCFLEYLETAPTGKVFDYIASGHYAQVVRDEKEESGTAGVARLFRAPDPVKDQSYFLCALEQSQLSRLIFPIGHLEKKEVRQLAEDFELPNRHRPDSQGLCFLGKVKFRDFMQIHLGEKAGKIVDAVTGETIGEHHGVWYHTVGQRKGIGPYLEPKAGSKGPWYVVAKDPSQNIVFASNQYDEDVFAQARSEFHVENISWIGGTEPTHLSNHRDERGETVYRFVLKIRHGPRLAAGTLTIAEEREGGPNHRTGGLVALEEKDGGLAPGQYVVFYTEDAECLGGGIISERHWARFLLDRQGSDESSARAAAEA